MTVTYIVNDFNLIFAIFQIFILFDSFAIEDKSFLLTFGQILIILNFMNYFILYYRISIIINTLILILLFIRIILKLPNNDQQYLTYLFTLSIFSIMIFNSTYLLLDVKLETSINFNKYYESKLMKVAHDLKNPLLAIQHLTDDQNDDINQYRQDIFEEVTEGIEILDDLRMKFKVSNQMVIKEETENVDLKQYVNRMQNAHVNLATKCNCKINTQFEFHIENKIYSINVKIQKTIVKRILNNFITNAIKHTPRGIVSISATCYIKDITYCLPKPDYDPSEGWYQEGNIIDPTNDYTIFTISDTGSGIPQSKMSDIFQEYTDQSNMNWDGCGLGLHICKVLTKDIGATIQYKSTIGIGSVFILLVPILNYNLIDTDLELRPVVTNNINNNINKANTIENSSGFNLHHTVDYMQSSGPKYDIDVDKHLNYELLIAEDNNVISKVYSNYLTKKKIPFKLFTNGRDCYDYVLSKMEEEVSFIIFTDNQMPEMSGIQLAHKIKQHQIACHMILVSADELKTDDLFDKVYEKPLPLSTFDDEINSFINKYF